MLDVDIRYKRVEQRLGKLSGHEAPNSVASEGHGYGNRSVNRSGYEHTWAT